MRIDKISYYIVDAFTKKNKMFSGNPACVIFCDTFFDDQFMQNLAMEFNLSATVFIETKQKNILSIRWFAPSGEIPICGHGTLAAARLLFDEGFVQKHEILKLQSKIGTIYCEKENNLIVINFPARSLTACQSPPFLKEALNNIDYDEVFEDEFIYLVVLKSEKDVETLTPHFPLIATVTQGNKRAVAVTSSCVGKMQDDLDIDFVTRYFAPKVLIPEDPVCGSVHTRLAPFWGKRLKKNKLIAYQMSKRGGYLYLENKTNRVFIKGDSLVMMKGDIISQTAL
jgi:PhzF family phenazine biosynthesis protein